MRRRLPHRRAVELLEDRYCLSAIGYELHPLDPWQIRVEAVADMDGDSDPDLVGFGLVNDRESQIGWQENLSERGEFRNAQVLNSVPARHERVVVGDVDGDGDNDIVALIHDDDSDRVVWYENRLTNAALFEPAQSIDVPYPQIDLLEGTDLDNDGDLDLVLGIQGSDGQQGLISWVENLRTDFVVRQTLAGYSYSIDFYDLDQDGDEDMITDGAGTWIENSNGRLVKSTLLPDSEKYRTSVTVDDIDGNGQVDLIVAREDLQWYEAPAGSTDFVLRQRTHSLAFPHGSVGAETGDFDGDGDRDLVVVSYWAPHVADAFVVQSFELGDDGSFDGNFDYRFIKRGRPFVRSEDISLDGRDELVFFDRWQSFATTDREFVTRQILYVELDDRGTLVDIDGDGDLDVLTHTTAPFLYDRETTFAWLEHEDGTSGFGQRKTIFDSTDDIMHSARALPIDMDGDGDLDLLQATREHANWFENVDGQGTFSWLGIGVSELGLIVGDVGDVDGDGDADLLSTTSDTNVIRWHEHLDSKGQMAINGVVVARTDDNFIGPLRLVDIDLDGDKDIVTAVFRRDGPWVVEKSVIWFEQLDGTRFREEQKIISLVPHSRATFEIRFADIDGDGDLDLIRSTFGPRPRTSVHRYSSEESVWGPESIVDNRYHASFSTIDFDGDGDVDVFPIATSNVSEDVWYENIDGLGTFRTRHIEGIVRDVGDIDGDGDVDLLIGDHRLFWGERRPVGDSNGDGRFGPADLLAVFETGEYDDGIPNNSSFGEGDWNGDGDFDSDDIVFAFAHGLYDVATATASSDLAAAIDVAFADDEQSRRAFVA